MRNYGTLDALFPATRRRVLAAAFARPKKWWYLTELAAHLKLTPSTLQRELASLTAGGILEERRDGRRVYIRPNAANPIFPQLDQLLEKTAGIIPTLREYLRPFNAKVDMALVYGSVAKGREHGESDVDLMVIGNVGLAELAPALRRAEKRLGREVNASVYRLAEFRRKMQVGDHFLAAVLRGDTKFVIGTQDELDEIAGNQLGATSHHV